MIRHRPIRLRTRQCQLADEAGHPPSTRRSWLGVSAAARPRRPPRRMPGHAGTRHPISSAYTSCRPGARHSRLPRFPLSSSRSRPQYARTSQCDRLRGRETGGSPQIVAAARTAKTSTAATNGLWLAAAVLGPPHAGQRWPDIRSAPGRAGILDSAARLAAPPGASRAADSRGLDQAQLRGKQQRCQLGQRDSASA